MKSEQIRKEMEVTPHAGVWIETISWRVAHARGFVTPHAGVWIETCYVTKTL